MYAKMNDIETGNSINEPTWEEPINKESRVSTKGGCYLRWSGVTKSVKMVEDNSGLMRSSISERPKGTVKKDLKDSGNPMKIILNNVSGSASPGEILALMGPSGSGKTSLLDALSGRSVFDKGILSVNGTEVKGAMMKKFKRKVAYVKQKDIFFGHLTVRDQLTYTALLRLPSSATRHEKHAEVNRIIDLLRLQKCADTPIRLLSGGERKRVNIGTELLTDPKVLLLDEPTSGLDSTSAVALLQTLHSLACNDGKTVVTSIHQPSSAVFRSFDKLIMLAEGHVVYFGTPVESITYLREINLDCPDGYNAADHWMDLLVVDSAIDDTIDDKLVLLEEKKEIEDTHSYQKNGSKSRQCLIDSWDNDAQATEVWEDIKNDTVSYGAQTFLTEVGKKYNTSWWTQFVILMHRAMRNSRSAIFTTLNMIKAGAIGTMMGLLWFQTPYTEATVHDREGYFFFTMTFWVFDSMFQAFMSFPMERAIIYKERASGSYRLSAYFLAKGCSEAPTRMALPCIYLLLSYWLAGIGNDALVFFGTLMCCLLAVISGESVGLLIGASIMDVEKGMVVLVVCSITLMVLGGFFIETVPVFMSWMKYLSAFKYAFAASRHIVFNKNIPCDGSGTLEVCKGGDTGHVTPSEIREILGVEGSIGFNVVMLFVMFLIPRYIAYLCLLKKKGRERM